MAAVRMLMIVGLIAILAKYGEGQEAKKKIDPNAIEATVKVVTPDKENKDIGVLTVTKKGGTDELKVGVDDKTKIERIEPPINKKDKEPIIRPVKLEDVKVGALISYTLKSGAEPVADKIKILPPGKK